MFIAEKYPQASFEGFAVEVVRQGRASLKERRLERTLIFFHPAESKVRIYLPRLAPLPSSDEVQRAWNARGRPAVHPLSSDECLLFGRPLHILRVPFAGWEDIRLHNRDTLAVCFKKAPTSAIEERLMHSFFLKATEERANTFFETYFRDRVTKKPLRIIGKKLGRQILGQCTVDGEIRLDPRHAHWSEDVLLSTLAHELTHLVHFDHSTAFWQEQTRLLPNWLELSLMIP